MLLGAQTGYCRTQTQIPVCLSGDLFPCNRHGVGMQCCAAPCHCTQSPITPCQHTPCSQRAIVCSGRSEREKERESEREGSFINRAGGLRETNSEMHLRQVECTNILCPFVHEQGNRLSFL